MINFNNISPDALVGVIGAIAGTILGWILNNISNSGKLILRTDFRVVTFYASDGHRVIYSYNDVKQKSIQVSCNIKIYNKHNIPTSIDMMKYIILVNGTKYNLFCDYDKKIFMNIQPYQYINYSLKSRKEDIFINAEDAKKGYKIYFVYSINGKERKRVLIEEMPKYYKKGKGYDDMGDMDDMDDANNINDIDDVTLDDEDE